MQRIIFIHPVLGRYTSIPGEDDLIQRTKHFLEQNMKSTTYFSFQYGPSEGDYYVVPGDVLRQGILKFEDVQS